MNTNQTFEIWLNNSNLPGYLKSELNSVKHDFEDGASLYYLFLSSLRF